MTAVGGGPESHVAVGASTQALLFPFIDTRCEGFIAGVVWHLDDPALASLLPEGRSVWVTGIAPGDTSLGARVTLADGVTLDARSRAVRVVPPEPPPGGQIVAEGSLTIQPRVEGVTGRGWSGWAPFTTQAAGRLDVVVDWVSPLNHIDFSGYEGHCDAIGSCGMIRMTVRTDRVKPLTATFDSPRMPAGDYTIRIDNLGPAEETVRYQVRLTPS